MSHIEKHSHSPPSTASPTLAKRADAPPIRRTPSKVPGDYDPVTGYYRRKSDGDVTTDEESHALDSSGKDLE
jgi:hypothetical protein